MKEALTKLYAKSSRAGDAADGIESGEEKRVVRGAADSAFLEAFVPFAFVLSFFYIFLTPYTPFLNLDRNTEIMLF